MSDLDDAVAQLLDEAVARLSTTRRTFTDEELASYRTRVWRVTSDASSVAVTSNAPARRPTS